MYLRSPHAGGAVAGPGARGEDPAPPLPGDQVGGGEQGEGKYGEMSASWQ